MRLRTCVALEVVVGASLVVGAAFGARLGFEELRQQWPREAQAASLEVASELRQLAPRPLITSLEPPGAIDPGSSTQFALFEGLRDEVLLDPLRTSPVARVKFNRGGSSISLRIEFENGARAAFKPRQTNLQTVPRREIAAYRINRLLGLSSVPPAIGRKFSRNELVAKLDERSRGLVPRLLAETVTDGDGYVLGELSWWIPVIERATVGGWRIDGLEGIVTWKRYLTVGKDIPAADASMAAQISDMVLFDTLINNPDRWTGGNARASEDNRILYFMDNTFSFGTNPEGHERTIIYLKRSQKFSRSLVARLRALTAEQIRDVVAVDVEPFDHLVSGREIEAMLARRDYALAYVDELIGTHGEDAVLVFP